VSPGPEGRFCPTNQNCWTKAADSSQPIKLCAKIDPHSVKEEMGWIGLQTVLSTRRKAAFPLTDSLLAAIDQFPNPISILDKRKSLNI